MGEVYLAQHPRLPRQDALKILPAEVSADGEFRERFLREADLASTLFHPHIVGVHDRGEFDGQMWISMDYIDGTDAAQLLRTRYPVGMPEHEVAEIITAIAGALDYAHKRGLLHRDVKPANIMLTHRDDEGKQRILLSDFGIARGVDDISGLTTTNMTVGTVAYTAPEQLLGEQIDGRADQYALAATAYHLLTGSQLYPHSNPAVVISRHLNAPVPALSDTRPELGRLDPVLAAGLAKDPADRFTRCVDFAHASAEQAEIPRRARAAPTAPARLAPKQTPRNSIQSRSKQGVVEPRLPGGPRRRWGIPAAAVVALLLVGAVALVWQPWQQRPLTTPPSTRVESPPAPSPHLPAQHPRQRRSLPQWRLSTANLPTVTLKCRRCLHRATSPTSSLATHRQRRSTPAFTVVHLPLPVPACVGRPMRELCCVAMIPGTGSFIAWPTRIRCRLCSRRRRRCRLGCFWMTALNAAYAMGALGVAEMTACTPPTVAAPARTSLSSKGPPCRPSTVLTPCGRSKSVHSGQATSHHPRRTP
ncbi:Mycobacterium numidiamassiliense ORFan [Mycobacterium numidiamassiliense]|uniref:non-specific serine/threonine protein kinase n=1 Tax=Mycobacterium numidiamassiliense TaxID=1841861 RepID=A0A2U3PIQ8_9MYCO|nr:Mycobacterium numidiamassiliense ORFan [Mycobacterium numidiamassiliense]